MTPGWHRGLGKGMFLFPPRVREKTADTLVPGPGSLCRQPLHPLHHVWNAGCNAAHDVLRARGSRQDRDLCSVAV